MKLDRKQDLNVFYQVCFFRADQKDKMAALSNPSTRAPRGTDRSPEYNEHFCYKLY